MDRAAQKNPPTLSRAGLGGLGIGLAVSSFAGPGILAGFVTVALAVGVFLASDRLAGGNRLFSGLAAGSAMLFPMAVAAEGERGILTAAALAFGVLAAARVLSRQVAGSLRWAAVSFGVVLHLGLLGSYLVLVASEGNRLLPALVLLAASFEVAYLTLAAREESLGLRRQKSRLLDPKAAVGGIVACQAAALVTRLFLPARLGLLSLLVLGTVVAGSALLGHASASAVNAQPPAGGRPRAVDPSVLPLVNALLFAVGAFYYGFRLYLT